MTPTPETPRIPVFQWLRRFAALWGFLLFLVFVLVVFRSVILPFVLGVVVAYVLSPLVDRLARRRLPRWISVIVVYLGLGAAITVFFVTFVPYLSGDFARLFREAPRFLQRVRTQYVPMADAWLERTFPQPELPDEAGPRPERKLVVTPTDGAFEISLEGLAVEIEPVGDGRYVLGPRSDEYEAKTRLSDMLGHAASGAQSQIKDVLLVGQRFLSSLLKGLAFFILTFMVAAYLLVDVGRVMGFLRSLVPEQHRVAWDDLLVEFDRGLSGVIRGQLLICVVNFVLTTIGLLLFKVKYALLLGMVAGAMSFIPVFGSILSSIPIVAIALASGSEGVSLSTGLAVLGWIIGIHLLEANLFNPKIIGDAAKIHPVVVVFALMVGEHTGGLIGALLAVPIASMVQAIFLFLRRRTTQPLVTA